MQLLSFLNHLCLLLKTLIRGFFHHLLRYFLRRDLSFFALIYRVCLSFKKLLFDHRFVIVLQQIFFILQFFFKELLELQVPRRFYRLFVEIVFWMDFF